MSFLFFAVISKSEKKPFKYQNINSPDIRFADAPANTLLPNPSNLNPSSRQDTKNQVAQNDKNQVPQTPMILNQKQILQQTPSTLTKELLSQSANPALHKQLKYEDSPSSMLINQSCDLASFKYVFYFIQFFNTND